MLYKLVDNLVFLICPFEETDNLKDMLKPVRVALKVIYKLESNFVTLVDSFLMIDNLEDIRKSVPKGFYPSPVVDLFVAVDNLEGNYEILFSRLLYQADGRPNIYNLIQCKNNLDNLLIYYILLVFVDLDNLVNN